MNIVIPAPTVELFSIIFHQGPPRTNCMMSCTNRVPPTLIGHSLHRKPPQFFIKELFKIIYGYGASTVW